MTLDIQIKVYYVKENKFHIKKQKEFGRRIIIMKEDYFDRLKTMRKDVEEYLKQFYFEKADEETRKKVKEWIESYMKEHDIGWTVTVKSDYFNFAVNLKTDMEMTFFVK